MGSSICEDCPMVMFMDKFDFLPHQAVLFYEQINLDSDSPHPCPSEVSNGGRADCFGKLQRLSGLLLLFKRTVAHDFCRCAFPFPPEDISGGASMGAYVSCHFPDSIVPKGVSTLICFQYRDVSVLTWLQALSFAAALFSLIFGTLVMILALILAQLKSERSVKLMFLLPLGTTILYIGTTALVQAEGVTALGLLFPFVIIAMCLALIRIKLTLMQNQVDRDKFDDPPTQPGGQKPQ